MKYIVKIVYILFSVILLLYLLLPNPDFPDPPSDFLQSNEPGDTEDPLRRAYFTDLARQEVLTYYENELSTSRLFSVPLPTYRLNYPPEEAQILIRDQTRSTFLEEIVHPLRQSFFVNGFEPAEEKDAIFIEGKFYAQKITVRFIPSTLPVRVVVGILIIALTYLTTMTWRRVIRLFKKEVSKIWIFR